MVEARRKVVDTQGEDEATEATGTRRAPKLGRRLPIARITTADAVYAQLHAAISRMTLVPGTPLQEKALIRLAEEGLVDIFPQSGTFVSRVPIDAIAEVVVIRQALEDAAVRRTAKIAGPADIARLDAIIAQQRQLAELD